MPKLLVALTGATLLCTSLSVQAVTVLFNGFSTTSGNYKEYRTSGYDIQPNRPGVWFNGCRTDNYYCMAQLERCNVYQGRGRRAAPVQFVSRPAEDISAEPSLLKDHR